MSEVTQNMSEITLKDAQKKVDEWIHTVGVRYFSELTTLAVIVEETGEIARILSRVYGDQSFKESEKNYHLGEEVADLLFALICLSNQTGIDLTEAFQQNIEKKTSRDKNRHQENLKLRS